MLILDVTVDGTPQAQGSKVRTRTGGFRESNENLRPWRDTLCWAFREAMKDTGVHDAPVHVSLTFCFRRPKYHFNKHGLRPGAPLFKGTKPDLDKLTRAVLDALTEAGVLRDDSLVVSLIASKFYGEEPGVLVRVESRSEVVKVDADEEETEPV